MNRTIVILLMFLVIPMRIMADNYTELWKRVEAAAQKDLPQTQIKLLDKIAAKAERERSYGQLLKAQLWRAKVQTEVSPDSLQPAVERLCAAEERVGEKEPVLAAVYESVLGRIYRDNSMLGENHVALSKQYYAQSLRHPELLAAASSQGYEPLVEKGIDSRIFNHDLLHVLGIEAQDYKTLYQYYATHDNRPAACICAARCHSHSLLPADLNLDSLMVLYADLPECGELALAKYHQQRAQKAMTPQQRVACIDDILSRWGTWKPLNTLRNERAGLVAPKFHVTVEQGMALPHVPINISIDEVRNVSQLSITITKLNITGRDNYEPDNADDLKKLKSLVQKTFKPISVSRHYEGYQPWDFLKDSVSIEGLPVGTYLMEVKADAEGLSPDYALLHVSNLYAMHETLPDNRMRVVVVDATTGVPVPEATVRLSRYARYGEKEQAYVSVTDQKGEINYTYDNQRPDRIYVCKDEDTAYPEHYLNVYFSYYNNENIQKQSNLYTDRALYRPGQTVYVSVLAWKVQDKTQHSVLANEEITLALRDANRKIVSEQNVVTDELGVASADFILPTSGLTGRFSIRCSLSGNAVSFSVEEYKRPTFQVEFDEVHEAYHPGDTIEVHGTARSFAGVPVQDAAVAVRVTRSPAFWWYHSNEQTEEIMADSIRTDADGRFSLRVPMLVPNSVLDSRLTSINSYYYTFRIAADATDAAGETRHGEMTLPLSNRATSFSLSMPTMILADSAATVTFQYLNNAGKPIEGTVSYYIDQEKKARTTVANTPVELPLSKLKSGEHTLLAVCGTDTLRQQFTVFSMSDKHPAMETHDWFYASAKEFPRDGGPIYIQMGSSDDNQHIVYTLIAGEKLLESGTIDQSNAVTTRTFTYQEEYGDGALFTCAWVRNGQLYKHQAELRKPLPDKRLLLKWTTFRDRLTPGQQEEWTLSVTRPDGTPARASLMATLFDRSLDEILQHSWSFSPMMWLNLPSTAWYGWSAASLSFFEEKSRHTVDDYQLVFSHFDDSFFPNPYMGIFGGRKYIRVRGSRANTVLQEVPLMASAKMEYASLDMADLDMADDMALQGKIAGLNIVSKNADTEVITNADTAGESVQMRENLNETAFFCPALRTDSSGHISLRFTLPESVTTWRFIGLAHDRDVNYGFLDGETVAKKDVMIQPNMPRFLRQGDEATISARLINTTDREVSGTARIQLLNAETEQVIYTEELPFTVEAGKTGSVIFAPRSLPLASQSALYICRMTAEGDTFSDGEQHYLPILPDQEMVTTTIPFTLQENQTSYLLPLSSHLSSDTAHLTLEYTNNPAWLMIQALPTVANANEKNAISLVSAFYANSIASHILHQSPEVKRVIELWQQERGEETSLMSSLEKNQELKSLVLDETPWVAEATSESDQKRQLINFFDENTVSNRLSTLVSQLSSLQNPDGSFSWWQGMEGNRYMTSAVVETLVRLNTLIGRQEAIAQMLGKALGYLAAKAHEEVLELKKEAKKGQKNLRPSELAVCYLYAQALDGTELTASQKEDVSYLTALLAKQTKAFTIYGKAVSSVVLAKNNYLKKASEYLQSIREYTVYTEEMGRYFDTPKAQYSWFDYRIPTEVAAIEAIRLLEPQDRQTVEEMQRWLLQSKRTQSWDTPVNTVNAVYAFLQGVQGESHNALHTPHTAVFKLNGELLDLPKATAGLGYVKTSLAVKGESEEPSLAIERTGEGTSWGALYIQQMQTVATITDASAGLKVTREMVAPSTSHLKIGDRVKVRLTIIAERDYDFVQLIDKRAACMEPVGQLSGYHWGYYCSPRDNSTNYYFDRLAKGKHVIETEYYIDRTGTYQTGTCTVQCAYAPEYTARTAAQTIHVE